MIRARIPSVLFVPCVLLLIGCTTTPPLPPQSRTVTDLSSTTSPGRPPQLSWEACPGLAYFVNYAPFSVPEIYIVIAGPLLFTAPEMTWQTEEQGLYCVGAETIP